MKKKRNRRNSTKYPGLRPELNLKTRSDLIDQDYISELPDKKIKHCSNPKGDCIICNDPKTKLINPKEWLNRFNEEYVNTNFNHKGERILKEELNPNPTTVEKIVNAGINHDINVTIVKENNYKKQAYDMNNSRNRDILTQQKASGRLIDYEKIKEREIAVTSPEDQLIKKEKSVFKKSVGSKNSK